MKKLMTMSALFFVFSCKAQQQILSMNTQGMHIENVYYKDLDNELIPYEGTWKGIYNNKQFIITFLVAKVHNSIGNYDQDRIIGKYKMIDQNNNEIYSTYNLTNINSKVMSLGFVEQTNKNNLRLLFTDLCIEGEIHVSFNNLHKTEIKWKYFRKQSIVTNDSSCILLNEMPQGELILLKQ